MSNLKERSIRDEDLQMLAQRYKSGDREALKEIFKNESVKGMIEALAAQNETPEYGLTEEDMLGYIHLAIIEKIDQYDESKSNLLTFIYIVANSACTSAIQRFSYEIKVPREHYRISTKIHKAEEKLWNRLERDPTLGELAEEVQLTIGELSNLRVDMLAPEQYSHHTCEEYEGDRWENVAADVESPDSSFAAGGLGREELLEGLDEKERLAIELEFFRGYDQHDDVKQIVKMMGVSRSSYYRIRAAALEKIKNGLKT